MIYKQGSALKVIFAGQNTTLAKYEIRIMQYLLYSVIHISIPPIKELCSKMAPGEVGVSLP